MNTKIKITIISFVLMASVAIFVTLVSRSQDNASARKQDSARIKNNGFGKKVAFSLFKFNNITKKDFNGKNKNQIVIQALMLRNQYVFRSKKVKKTINNILDIIKNSQEKPGEDIYYDGIFFLIANLDEKGEIIYNYYVVDESCETTIKLNKLKENKLMDIYMVFTEELTKNGNEYIYAEKKRVSPF